MGFYIEMINVGQGDSFLLTLDNPNGSEAYVLIDGGNRDKEDNIIKHIKDYAGGHVHLVIATHLDDDHIGGLIKVVDVLKIDKLILNTPGNFDKWLSIRDSLKKFVKVTSIAKLEKGIAAANELLETAKRKQIPVEHAYQGRSWSSGEITLEVLSPTEERLQNAWAEKILEDISDLQKNASRQFLVEAGIQAPPTTESNDASIILELGYKKNPYALFTGDAGADVIKQATSGKTYPFLKVPHHGSKTGLDEELIKQISPKNAFIPVGENPHGHPSIEILDLLKSQGAITYCSEKTKDCRRECKDKKLTILCHRIDKPIRAEWTTIDPHECLNNPKY